MSSGIDVSALAGRLHALESIALIDRVRSTNEIGRLVVRECVENEIPLPRAIVVAREQSGGRGRASRSWHSPKGKGIYATVLYELAAPELALVPLRIGVVVAKFLRETFGIDARLKWPNDVLVGGRKIAGILIESRSRDSVAAVLIGIGINVFPDDAAPPNACSIAGSSTRHVDLDSATTAFVEAIDEAMARPAHRDEVLREWNAAAAHQKGDTITFHNGDETITGTWAGIDDSGRAMIRTGTRTITVAAGEILVE